MSTVATDPVCGMPVGDHALHAVWREVTYSFCSEICRSLFVKQPARYVAIAAQARDEHREIAYFSMEIAVDPAIPTYCGGLGILAGDMLRSCADLGVAAIGVTLLYRDGYFRQTLDADGRQSEEPCRWRVDEQLRPLSAMATIRVGGRDVAVRAWEHRVRGPGGEVPVLFLDTDLEANHPEDRALTRQLYGGDQRHRLCQGRITSHDRRRRSSRPRRRARPGSTRFMKGPNLLRGPTRVLAVLIVLSACATAPKDVPGPGPQWLSEPALEDAFRAPGPLDLSGPQGLADVLRLAAERNPRLAAARERWLAATERPAQERALPDPLFAYLPMVDDIQTRAGPMESQYQLTQRIPYPAKLSAAREVAEEEAQVREFEYRAAIRDVVADVKASYAELLYLRKAQRIVEQNRALAQQLAEKGAALYAGAREEGRTDAVTLFDTLKAQSQIAQLAYDGITLEELRQTEEANLNQLLSRAPEAPLGPPEDLAFRPLHVRRDELYRLALDHRQELEGALHRVAAAEQAARLARLSRVPDFQIGATYSEIGTPPMPVSGGGQDALGLMFGITLPIWETKNRARIAEAEYRRDAALHDRQAMVDDLMARISKVYFRLQNAERLVHLYGESLLPQAEEAMEVAEQWRDVGRDTFGRLLEAQSVWLNFQLAYHRALADHEQMVARLEQLVGKSLADLRGAPGAGKGGGAGEGAPEDAKEPAKGGSDEKH